MSKSTNITYIIPAYNCGGTIAESIESILNNIDVNDEIVIVNDCSTDNTLEIINKYATKHPQIKVINHENNKGGAAARNTAVRNSSNELIFCLDSDNLLLPNSVCNLKQALIDTNADAAAFQTVTFFSKKTTIVSHKWLFKQKFINFQDALCSGICPISSGNYLYKKSSWERVGGYPEFAKSLDAWGFGLRQLANDQKMVILENSTYLHRIGHESYWIREAKSNNLSVLASKILEPFFDKLTVESRQYLLSEEGNETWFTNIEMKPIVLKSNIIGQPGVLLDSMDRQVSKLSILSRVKFRLSCMFL